MARPLKFETPKMLEEKIDEYFAVCDKGEEVEELTKRGDLVKYTRAIPYTVEGLALHLDCESQTLRNYGKRDEFLSIVSRAREKIFQSWIKGGLNGQFNPKIVALCLAANFGPYNIRTEQQVGISIEDRLRQIREQRLALQDPDTTEGELIEQKTH